MTSIRTRVETGALILAANRDDRWWDKIDLDRLNLDHVFDCVLGQLYGSYGTGLEVLGLNSEEAHDAGLWYQPDWDDSRDDIKAEYRQLTAAWCDFIAGLRSFAKAVDGLIALNN